MTRTADNSYGNADSQETPLQMAAAVPIVELVAPTRRAQYREWDNELFRAQQGTWRLTGKAGSGVTSLLLDTVAARIRNGADPASIAVISTSKEAAGRLRRGLVERLEGYDYVSGATVVRSVHSLAFAILRNTIEADLRLITGAEQDAVMSDLLAGHAEEGAWQWPENYREAISLMGFSRGLRDFLLRAAERGISPEQVEQLGAEFNKEMWKSAGSFMREYEQAMELGGNKSLSASELVSTVLLGDIPDQGFKAVFVDDAQHLDPKSGELVGKLVEKADFAVIAGDPEQSIFHFRGASPDFLKKYPVDHELVLSESFRKPEISGHIFNSETKQWEYAAGIIRQRHLLDGVQWKDMAVVVRSMGQIGPARRALTAAGVPVHIDLTDIVLTEQRIVSSIILVIQSLLAKPTIADVEELVIGPIGGADPVMLRKLLRALRRVELARGGSLRAMEMLRILIWPGKGTEQERQELSQLVEQELNDREKGILERVRTVMDAGNEAIHNGGSIEEILWAVWSASGLSAHLAAQSLRGGAAGSQADRDLDAMMALFDIAGDWTERRPDAGIRSFMESLTEQELPAGVRDRRLNMPDAVSVITAHGAPGREWNTVVVAGVYENIWPDLSETGTLFDQEEFTDLVDAGIDPATPISHISERLKEEKRLFNLALSRGTELVEVLSVDSPDGDIVVEPSRFMRDIPTVVEQLPDEESVVEDGAVEDMAMRYFRPLSVPSVVAELRRAVGDMSASEEYRVQAARQLAKLARAGVPGADPKYWWGSRGVSESEPLDIRTISPSMLETGLACPLRASLSKIRVDEEATIPMVRGTLIHAYAEAIGSGVAENVASELVTQAYLDIVAAPLWQQDSVLESWNAIIRKLTAWIAGSEAKYELVGLETDVEVEVAPGVVIRGKIDRLERGVDGLRIIDFKTAKTAPSQADAEENKQLWAYQLALDSGTLITDDNGVVRVRTGDGEQVAQASLVYPGTSAKGITVRDQARKDPEQLAMLRDQLPELLEDLRGPVLKARVNKTCDTCQFKVICPVQPEGKTVL